MANFMRKTLKLDVAKIALLQEMARPLPQDAKALAKLLKALRIAHAGLRPMDQAISTAGGVRFDAVDDTLMLRARPGVFVAGEMLDWEAPTGGYLISACLATGRWAGQNAAVWAQKA
jgi:predicted flavoprotein YhiN